MGYLLKKNSSEPRQDFCCWLFGAIPTLPTNLKPKQMKTYNFKKGVSHYHINLHRDTLTASINYNKRRGLDISHYESELKQLNDFYGKDNEFKDQ